MDMESGLVALCGKTSDDDEKRARILEGALKVFLAYGFNRTTMDDIARAAELSRPALYLVFRNKADIYRALASCVFDEMSRKVHATLSGEGSFAERLERMVETAFHLPLREIAAAPHGPELLDMKNSLAGELLVAWRETVDALIEAAVADEARRAGVDLQERGFTARAAAEMLMDSFDGMKTRLGLPGCNLETARPAVRVLAAVLRP